ncbi:MAG: hypothetical protein LBR11_06365 [Deltaproteobacteria bacterium]|jgi:transposase|nr:hypothetical protein [Deltaproteobacteria bacterium]
MTPVLDDERYSFYKKIVNYGNKEYLWVTYHSSLMAKKQELTFEKKINKTLIAGKAALRTLSQQPFACEEDAQRAAERWIKKQRLLKSGYSQRKVYQF